MTDEIRITKVEVREKDKELFFTVNEKAKYKIPSKLFPLANKKIGWYFYN